jgi:hypothetical protein
MSPPPWWREAPLSETSRCPVFLFLCYFLMLISCFIVNVFHSRIDIPAQLLKISCQTSKTREISCQKILDGGGRSKNRTTARYANVRLYICIMYFFAEIWLSPSLAQVPCRRKSRCGRRWAVDRTIGINRIFSCAFKNWKKKLFPRLVNFLQSLK